MRNSENIYNLDVLWEELDRTANNLKCSQQATLVLSRLYETWDEKTQLLAQHEFCNWLMSRNVRKRFDALVMVEQLGIVSASENLLRLKEQLTSQDGPEAKFEVRRIDKILANLQH